MKRTTLPERRRSLTQPAAFEGHQFTITIGFDDRGQPKEVFADVAKGSVMSALIADSCVAVSLLLQHGTTPEAIGKSLGRIPNPIKGLRATKAASPIGVIIEMLTAEVPEGEANNDD